jgi:hypothetical protein
MDHLMQWLLEKKLWLTLYLLLNCILSIISKSLMDRADRYWSQGEDAPDDFLTLVLLYPNMLLSKHVTYLYGYARALWFVVTFRKHLLFVKDKWFNIKLQIIFGVILLLAFIPIFIVGVISEIYWAIYSYRENKK